MPSSIDTRISMLTPPVSRRAHFALPKKTYTQIKAFEVFAFRWILTGPRGCPEAMWLSRIRPVRSDGVVRSSTQHFHLALGTGWVVPEQSSATWMCQSLGANVSAMCPASSGILNTWYTKRRCVQTCLYHVCNTFQKCHSPYAVPPTDRWRHVCTFREHQQIELLLCRFYSLLLQCNNRQ